MFDGNYQLFGELQRRQQQYQLSVLLGRFVENLYFIGLSVIGKVLFRIL